MHETPKGTWTEDDFEQMGWHDCRVHALSFDPDAAEIPGSVALDLDYILQWVHPEEGGRSFSFWVAPATLVFPGASDLVLHAALDGFMDLRIDGIRRAPIAVGPRRSPSFRWTLDGEFTLELTARGFRQYLRAAPEHVTGQSLPLDQRGGISFDTQPYR